MSNVKRNLFKCHLYTNLKQINILGDGYVQSTTTTTTTRPTTPTLPAMSIKEMSSCQSEYGDLLSELSCDFTDDFCKYSKNDSPVHWQRKQGVDGIAWFGQIPKRNTTLSGTLLLSHVMFLYQM